MNAHAPRRIVRRHAGADGARLVPQLPAVLERIYRHRNVQSAAELDRTLERLAPPSALLGMDRAVDLLEGAIRDNTQIVIVADFDADGATSCALMVRALREMGAAKVGYIVPNRFEYGYGLTPEIVELASVLAPQLLITVDNGISSIDGVAAAKSRGIQVLVTDHHLAGAELPAADAIVNPNQPGDSFPSKALAGVGVAFYVMLALRARLRSTGWFGESRPEPNLAKLLDLVALGTVADVVPLDHNNRILVAQGLARINAGKCCPGIFALLAVGGRRPGRLGTADLGFIVGPRLNAAGRLTDMTHGIECLLADSPADAERLALELDKLNRERRAIEQEMQAQALAAVQTLAIDDKTLPHGLCLFDESWHQGVVGLVASRIKERTHRPVIAFALASESELKGSARSVPGLHIRDALDAIATRHPKLLTKFGGHAMAAGLSLARENFLAFTQAFDEEVARWLSDDDLEGKIFSDGELSSQDLTLDLAEHLREAGPWGQGFPEPMFDNEFEVLDQRVVGEKHLKLRLRHGGRRAIDAIAFNSVADPQALPSWTRVRAAYRLDVNDYQGSRQVQLVIEHLEPAGSDV